jgi:hypothetical protein
MEEKVWKRMKEGKQKKRGKNKEDGTVRTKKNKREEEDNHEKTLADSLGSKDLSTNKTVEGFQSPLFV